MQGRRPQCALPIGRTPLSWIRRKNADSSAFSLNPTGQGAISES